MHYNNRDYDAIVELIIYWSDGDDYPHITQIWSANNAHPFALQKLLSTFEHLIPLTQIIHIGKDTFIKAIFNLNKITYRYQFERLDEINEYQDAFYFLH
jgi:hypothetical protein